jgi:hypothetical protein
VSEVFDIDSKPVQAEQTPATVWPSLWRASI